MATTPSPKFAGIGKKAYERASESVAVPGMRRVTLRIGFVLGCEGGALPVLARLTKLFLGGPAGNGRQYISWIHLADVVRAFSAAVANEAMSGTYNTVAPKPVTNAEFMRELASHAASALESARPRRRR